VHLRRALLLFAIVLGLAALVASVSGPRNDAERSQTAPATTERAPTATSRPSTPDTVRIVFPAGRRATRRLSAGRSAVLLVEARTAGQVEIPGLGLSQPVDPRTPARFDVLPEKKDRYEIRFTSAESGEVTLAGTLVVGRS
jgi:hypothetical protein